MIDGTRGNNYNNIEKRDPASYIYPHRNAECLTITIIIRNFFMQSKENYEKLDRNGIEIRKDDHRKEPGIE